ncbi:FA81B protein, partial [Nothocercus nigrocapillus]|nr:FA81B protein [Nothocercus nigrocapillus]
GLSPPHRRETSLPPRAGNGVRQLEERLSRQERTTGLLLEQAALIKDDLVSCLRGPRGGQQGDVAAQQLLQSHVQAVVGAVKQLCRDVQVGLRRSDYSGNYWQNPSNCYNADFFFLSGLLASLCFGSRCEASIAKLAGDINIIRHEAHRTDKEIYGVRSALEKSVMQLLGKIKTSSSDQSSNLKTVQGDQHHELQLLDFKLTTSLNDFKAQIQTQQKWTEMQLSRSEQDQAYHRNQLLHSLKERLETAEKRLEEKLLLLSLKLERTDRSHKYEKQLDQMKNEEKALQARIAALERQVWEELEEVQREYRSG